MTELKIEHILMIIIIVFLLFNNKILDRFTVSSMGCKPFPPQKKCDLLARKANHWYYYNSLKDDLLDNSYCRDYFDDPERCDTFSKYCIYNFLTGDTCTNKIPG